MAVEDLHTPALAPPMHIDTGSHKPVRSRYYKLGSEENKVMKETVEA